MRFVDGGMDVRVCRLAERITASGANPVRRLALVLRDGRRVGIWRAGSVCGSCDMLKCQSGLPCSQAVCLASSHPQPRCCVDHVLCIHSRRRRCRLRQEERTALHTPQKWYLDARPMFKWKVAVMSPSAATAASHMHTHTYIHTKHTDTHKHTHAQHTHTHVLSLSLSQIRTRTLIRLPLLVSVWCAAQVLQHTRGATGLPQHGVPRCEQ